MSRKRARRRASRLCASRLRPAARIRPPSVPKPPLGLPDRPRRASRSAAAPANAAIPQRHVWLEAVVFWRARADVPRTNQRDRAALRRKQGPQPPTIIDMGPLRPLQTPTVGADTAACLLWAVSGRHVGQIERERWPTLSTQFGQKCVCSTLSCLGVAPRSRARKRPMDGFGHT